MSDGSTRRDSIDELLGAYALDAVDDIERRRVEAYMAANPTARAEVEAHREVAALMAVGGESPPEGLWDRIAGALEEPAPAPGPRLARVMPTARRSRRRAALTAIGAAAVAAAAAVLVTVAVVRPDDSPSDAAAAIEQAYEDAGSSPGSRRTELISDGKPFTADAIVLADGTGFLAASDLPQLPDTETWQLWGVYGDEDVISLGVLGSRPELQTFTAHDDLVSLVITHEKAGGVVSSTTGAVLVGQLA